MPPSRARRRRATATSRPSTARTAATCPPDDHFQPETRPVPRRPAPDSPVWQRERRPEVVAYKRRRRKAKAKDEDDVEVEVEVEEEDVDRAAHPLAKQTDGDVPEPSAPKRARHVAGSGAPTSGVMKQLFLDLGQKKLRTRPCPACGLLYARGEPSDERAHDAYHARAIAAAGTATRPRADADPKSTSNVIAGTGGDPCAKNWGAEGANVDGVRRRRLDRGHVPRGPSQTVGQGEIVGDDDGGTIGSARGMDLRRRLRREGVCVRRRRGI